MRLGAGYPTSLLPHQKLKADLDTDQTPPVHDAFDPLPPPSAASTDLLLTSPTQDPMFPEGHELSPIANPDKASVPSSAQPAADVNADANIETNNGQEPPGVDKNPLEPRLPVRTASPTITALKAVLLRSRASLNGEEKKHDEKAAPENNEVLRAKNKVDTLKAKLEDVKWEYERAKAEFEAHEQERVVFRARHRELDEAERELEELCHSRETQEV